MKVSSKVRDTHCKSSAAENGIQSNKYMAINWPKNLFQEYKIYKKTDKGV